MTTHIDRTNHRVVGPLVALALGAVLLPAAEADSALAQERAAPDDARVITFQDGLRLALDGSTDILRSRAELELRGVVEDRERMDFIPSLSLSTRGTRSFGRSFSQEEGQILSETNDIFDAGVSANLTLFDGGENFASLRQASLEEDASRLRLERTRENILFSVVQRFTTLVQDRELQRVRAEELAAARDLLEQVQRLVEIGRQPVSDLYQQQAAVAEAEAVLVDARRQVALTETGLIQVLELDPLEEYRFVTPELPDSTPPLADLSFDALLTTALERRGDLAASERALAASDEGVSMAKSGRWPSLAVSFSYGSNWSGNSTQPIPGTGIDPRTIQITPDGGGEPITLQVPGSGSSPERFTPDFLDQLDGRRGGRVSLSMSLPIFDGFQTRSQVAQAEVARRTARYDLEDQRQQVALEVRTAILDYRSAVARRAAAQRRLEAAERGWTAAERRYELGAATFVELGQARSTLVGARSEAIRARFDVLLAQRRVEFNAGTLEVGESLFIDAEENDR